MGRGKGIESLVFNDRACVSLITAVTAVINGQDCSDVSVCGIIAMFSK